MVILDLMLPGVCKMVNRFDSVHPWLSMNSYRVCCYGLKIIKINGLAIFSNHSISELSEISVYNSSFDIANLFCHRH